MNTLRRRLCGGALAAVGALLGAGVVSAKVAAKPAAKDRVLKIQAKKFAFTPNRIELKKGEPVVLQLSALDFMHGFKVPDWNIRADLPPGQVTIIRITPDQAGEFDFLCDNFCGEGHEQMSGKFIVAG